MASKKKPHDPFRWFDSSPKVIRLVVMMYVRYPLSLRGKWRHAHIPVQRNM
jgi:putative transposase